MSIAPDLDRILQIIAVLDQGMQEMASPDAFLQQVLPEIAACIPQVRGLRAYNINRNKATLQASVGEALPDERNVIKIAPGTLTHTQPIYDPQRSVWTIPLQTGGSPFALLEVSTGEAPTPDLANWLQIIGHHLSMALRLSMAAAHQLDISDQQTQVFNELNSSQDFMEMVQIIAHHLLPAQNRSISLYGVIYDNQGKITNLDPLASADRDQVNTPDQTTVPEWEHISQEYQRMLEQGIPFVLDDALTQPADVVGIGFHEWFKANNIRSLMNIPVLINGRLTAMLLVISRVKTIFTREELNAFSSVAGQLGALVETRSLLSDAEASRETANNLVLASRMITTAEDYSDMLQAATYTVAKGMAAVAITLFEPALGDGRQPRNRSMAAIGTSEDLIPLPTSSQAYSLPHNIIMGDLQRGQPVIITDLSTDETYAPAGIRKALADLGINWLAAFGLRAGEQLLGTLDIMHTQAYQLTVEEIDAYTTLADQMGSAIRSRLLLEQTASALNFVQAQYETISTIYAAEDPQEILKIIHHFAAATYEHAHLGLIESEVEPLVVRILAEISPAGSRFPSRTIPLDYYPAHDTLSAVETLYIPNVSEDHFLSAEERENLLKQNILSIVIVPMVINRVLTGMVVFTHPRSNQITPEHLRALRILADQMAVVFQNRSLLRSTAESLVELEILYGINHSLLRSQDALDVLRTAKDYLASDAASLSRLIISYTQPGEIDEVTLTHIINAEGEQIVQTPLYRLIGTEKAAALNALLSQRRLSTIFVEDTHQPQPSNPLIDFIQQEGIWSYIVIPIYESDLLREIISFSFGYPQVFDTKRRRLYESVGDQMSIVLQSQRLLQETQFSATQLTKEVRVLQVLNQLALTMTSAISAEVGEKELLNRGVEALVSLLGIDHCSFVMFDSTKSSGTILSEYPDKGLVGNKINLLEDPLLVNVHNLQPVLFSDVDTDPRLREENRRALRSIGVKSFLIIPVVVRGNLIGSFGLDMYTERAFTPDIVTIAQTITAQIGIGLQNIHLLEDAQRRAEQLQQVTALSQRIQAALDVSNILEIMLSQTVQMLPVNRMSIALYDGIRNQLRVAAQYEDGKTLVDIEGGPVIPTTGTLIGQVWQSQEALYIADTAVRPELRQTYQSDIRSLLIVPILARGRILGVINIGSSKQNAYSETDRAVFQQLLNQLAIAIENTYIYTQSQRQAKNESLVNEIAIQFQQQMDIDSMLNITMQELGKALGARRARIRLKTSDGDSSM